jgi:hypothetical protein
VAAGQRWRCAAPYATGLAAAGQLPALIHAFFDKKGPQNSFSACTQMSQIRTFFAKKLSADNYILLALLLINNALFFKKN